MKKILEKIGFGIGLLVMGVTVCFGAGDAVEAAAGSFTNTRGDVVGYINATEYYEADTFVMTNCLVYSGSTTSSALQGLSNVTVQVRVGRLGAATTYTGTVCDTESTTGSWWCSVTVPTNTLNDRADIQVRLTDENETSFTYPWKRIHTKEGM